MKEGQMPNDGELLNRWIWEVAGRSADKLRQILVDNPRKLFNFGAAS
jgi:hypothetical protein